MWVRWAGNDGLRLSQRRDWQALRLRETGAERWGVMVGNYESKGRARRGQQRGCRQRRLARDGGYGMYGVAGAKEWARRVVEGGGPGTLGLQTPCMSPTLRLVCPSLSLWPEWVVVLVHVQKSKRGLWAGPCHARDRNRSRGGELWLTHRGQQRQAAHGRTTNDLRPSSVHPSR